jgi:hypothetical protein
MYIHQQFTFPYRKFWVSIKRKIILEHTVSFCTDDPDRTIRSNAPAYCNHGLHGRRSPCVSHTIIMIYYIVRISLAQFMQVSTSAQVLILPFCRIFACISSYHYAGPIHSLPETDIERNLAVSIEWVVTPGEFLSRKTDKSGMRRCSWKSPSEAKAVRKEYISTLDTEFFTIEMLSVKNITRKRLY